MGFQNGHKKLGGRKKAVPNAKTADLRQWIEEILNGQRSVFEQKMKQLPAAKYVDCYLSLLSFSVPKQQSVSYEAKVEAEYKQLQVLLASCPEEFVEKIAARMLEMQEGALTDTNNTNEALTEN